MAFSRAQHAQHYRPTVAVAARKRGIDPKNRAALDEWIRARLNEWAGVSSTQDLNPLEDFEYVMYQLELIIGGDIYWARKYQEGARKRYIYKITKLCREHEIDESYARGIARQALGLEELPMLETMEPKKLRTLVTLFASQGRRMGMAAKQHDDNEPF